jgi:hypothetical protein
MPVIADATVQLVAKRESLENSNSSSTVAWQLFKVEAMRPEEERVINSYLVTLSKRKWIWSQKYQEQRGGAHADRSSEPE